jgi:hypothetical protein
MQKSGDLRCYSCTDFSVCSTSVENDIFVTCVAFYHNVDHLSQQLLDFYVGDVLARVLRAIGVCCGKASVSAACDVSGH